MLAFLKLQMTDGNEIAVNVESIAGVIGQEGARGAKVLLTGGHEVEVLHSHNYILVNLQRQLVGKEPLSDED